MMLEITSHMQRSAESGKWYRLATISWVLLLSACTHQAIPKSDTTAIEQRLQKLEERVESLERYDAITPSTPLRSREEIEERIKSLEAERTTLLEQYQSAHPYVRDIDLRLRLLRVQLEMLNQAQTTTK